MTVTFPNPADPITAVFGNAICPHRLVLARLSPEGPGPARHAPVPPRTGAFFTGHSPIASPGPVDLAKSLTLLTLFAGNTVLHSLFRKNSLYRLPLLSHHI